VQFLSLGKFNRFSQVSETIGQNAVQENEVQRDSIVQPQHINSARTHYLIWQNAVSLMKKHLLFGVGAGDVHEELNKEFAKNGFEHGTESSFNAHNQFLNTGVALGFIGLLLFLAVVCYPAWLAFRSREWMYLLLLAVIFLNCLTESILERQAAILLFSFFYCLLAIRHNASEMKEKIA
jgi:O-antigen ligase